MWTGRAEGDLGTLCAGSPAELALVEDRRRKVLDRPWSWLRQQHGAGVVEVGCPGGAAGEEGDALVSARQDVCLAVFSADCAPVAMASPEGVMGAAHAGWRGLEAGVLEACAEAMRSMGASRIEARLGPCVHPECYEFSAGDLARLEARLGSEVRSETGEGSPALDLPRAVAAALRSAGVELVGVDSRCTACSPRYFSHRARGDHQRQALVVWR